MGKKAKADPNMDALRTIVQAEDMDGVLYKLREIAVEKRDAATNNKAEEDYWQRVIPILCDAEEAVTAIA